MHDRLLKSVPDEPTAFKLVLHRRMHLSRVRCWVGVSVPEEGEPMASVSPSRQLWRRAEKTLDIQYGATFETTVDNLRAGRIGQTVYLDCQADANPAAQLSLYRIGSEGQQILWELAMLELDQLSNITPRYSKGSQLVLTALCIYLKVHSTHSKKPHFKADSRCKRQNLWT
ncbi:hypothetical protein AHF37_07817 [Paragonimus kellicotti]|nr:hypothetical protein AHF37_07817 [Paragonimus kellicotti]